MSGTIFGLPAPWAGSEPAFGVFDAFALPVSQVAEPVRFGLGQRIGMSLPPRLEEALASPMTLSILLLFGVALVVFLLASWRQSLLEGGSAEHRRRRLGRMARKQRRADVADAFVLDPRPDPRRAELRALRHARTSMPKDRR
ncbi:MAG: hypothetical protein ACPGID_07670 [Rubricella sp.]